MLLWVSTVFAYNIWVIFATHVTKVFSICWGNGKKLKGVCFAASTRIGQIFNFLSPRYRWGSTCRTVLFKHVVPLRILRSKVWFYAFYNIFCFWAVWAEIGQCFGSEFIDSGSSYLSWIPIRIWIQGFDDQKFKKMSRWICFLNFFFIKNCNLLFPRPPWRTFNLGEAFSPQKRESTTSKHEIP